MVSKFLSLSASHHTQVRKSSNIREGRTDLSSSVRIKRGFADNKKKPKPF